MTMGPEILISHSPYNAFVADPMIVPKHTKLAPSWFIASGHSSAIPLSPPLCICLINVSTLLGEHYNCCCSQMYDSLHWSNRDTDHVMIEERNYAEISLTILIRTRDSGSTGIIFFLFHIVEMGNFLLRHSVQIRSMQILIDVIV